MTAVEKHHHRPVPRVWGRPVVASVVLGPPLLFTLVACAQPAGDIRMGPARGDAWSVTVGDPVDLTNTSACEGDPSVAYGVITADLPPSHLGLTLTPDATEADALRIAECLRSALQSGEIMVHPPA